METGAHPVRIRGYRKPVNQAFLDNDPDTASGRLLVVNRIDSPFGAGWWPAGVEQLVPDTGGVMLVYGDGSSLYFRKQGSSYLAPPGEHSILTKPSGSVYRRKLLGGRVNVWYSSNGLPDSISDNNSDPNTAIYQWDGDELESITDPTGKSITLNYGANSVTIAIPGLSATTLTMNGSGDLTSITDPDSFITTLSYATGTHRLTTSKARGTGTFNLHVRSYRPSGQRGAPDHGRAGSHGVLPALAAGGRADGFRDWWITAVCRTTGARRYDGGTRDLDAERERRGHHVPG